MINISVEQSVELRYHRSLTICKAVMSLCFLLLDARCMHLVLGVLKRDLISETVSPHESHLEKFSDLHLDVRCPQFLQ